MSPEHPRLCMIYFRDALQFTNPTLINKCRQVSRRCDSMIGSIPEARLPKRYFEMSISSKVGALPSFCYVDNKYLRRVFFRISTPRKQWL